MPINLICERIDQTTEPNRANRPSQQCSVHVASTMMTLAKWMTSKKSTIVDFKVFARADVVSTNNTLDDTSPMNDALDDASPINDDLDNTPNKWRFILQQATVILVDKFYALTMFMQRGSSSDCENSERGRHTTTSTCRVRRRRCKDTSQSRSIKYVNLCNVMLCVLLSRK